MLEGIIVLNRAEIMDIPWPFIIIAVIVALGLAVVLAIQFDWAMWTAPAGLFFGFGVVIVIVTIFDIPTTKPTGRYRYECTIDESVSMTEVYERFEIIEQRGDIWVLEDKE